MSTVKEDQVECISVAYTYRMTKKQVVDVENDISYTTYGIEVLDSTSSAVLAYPDISTKEGLVNRIVDDCNRCEADILHLEDILYDYIG